MKKIIHDQHRISGCSCIKILTTQMTDKGKINLKQNLYSCKMYKINTVKKY